MEEAIKKLLQQREDISREIRNLAGTKSTYTRETLLQDLRSLDSVLKEWAKVLPPHTKEK